MNGAGTDGAHAYAQVAGELGLGTGGESCGLLVAASHPLDVLGGADGFRQRIECVPDDAEHLAYAEFAQRISDEAGNGTGHRVLLVRQ